MAPPPALPVVGTVRDLRSQIAAWRHDGARIALVPTMGALHEGHLSLVRQAGTAAERVVVTIFVNPKQFAPSEDLATYPRDLAHDAELLAATPAALIFAPDGDAVYPHGFATRIMPDGVALDLEANFRPHFFTGVATVVCKLLLMAGPDIAVFGEKDYQQLLVVRQLVRDLNIPVDILAGPIVREADGLALSSRNVYLSAEERAAAPVLAEVIHAIARNLARGASIAPEVETGHARLMDAGFRPTDYLEVRDAETLAPLEAVTRPARVLAAAWLGKTRLIDNTPVAPPAG